jgi:hypothetical protein
MAFPMSAENKATLERPSFAPDQGSPYSYHVKSACVAHPAPMRSGSGHPSHEERPLRYVLISSPCKIRGDKFERLGWKFTKFLKGLVGATGIEPVTPPV